MAAGAALAVKGVDLRFGGIFALRGVSCAAAPGETTPVTGPNAAGKTSVFDATSGFYRPATGRIILLDGQDIAGVPCTAARRAAWRAPSRSSRCFMV